MYNTVVTTIDWTVVTTSHYVLIHSHLLTCEYHLEAVNTFLIGETVV